MKLIYTPASPFARKVLVVAHELGMADRIELVVQMVTPVEPNPRVTNANPLSKVPALVLDDGSALFDSRVITEYLMSLEQAVELLPGCGSGRWSQLRTVATADGLLDAAVAIRYETTLRPVEALWPAWVDAQQGKIDRALTVLALDSSLRSPLSLAGIAVACALAYLDFRFPALSWRDRHPRLAEHLGWFADRSSMQLTAPSTTRTRAVQGRGHCGTRPA